MSLPLELDGIREAVDRRREEILAWTRTLIGYASENRPPGGNEGELQEFLAGECRRQGWQVELFSPEEVPGIQEHPYWLAGRDYSAGRRNLVARWPGRAGAAAPGAASGGAAAGARGAAAGGPSTARSLLFSSHADVAPFEPDGWTVCRPYQPVLQEGRLYGRGAADLKGGLAASFWALKLLGELGFQPAADVLFESVVDEEFAGGNGTLASRLKGCNAQLAVVTEPTRMQVCPACLGAFLGELTLTGKAGMPYTGSAIPNPIFGAARAVELFGQFQELWRRDNDHPLFREAGKELNVLLWGIDSNRAGEFTQMGTPLSTRLSWIVWCHPGTTEEGFWKRFWAYWQEQAVKEPALEPFQLELTPTYHHVRAWETPADHPAVRAVAAALRDYSGEEPVVGGAPFSCDLGLYGDPGGMPCLLLGPRGDNLHAPDEWVFLEDVYTLTGVFAELTRRWCA